MEAVIEADGGFIEENYKKDNVFYVYSIFQ